MSTNAAQIEIPEEAYQESLAERLTRGPLPLPEALRYATEIATTLRDLHAQGLAYGAVSSHLILLAPSGASLRHTGGLTRLGDGQSDVAAFGAVLDDMLYREVSVHTEVETLREELFALARHCAEDAPDMRQVLIALRILRLQARQTSTAIRRPVAPPLGPVEEATPVMDMLRDGLHMAMQWRPLANLANLANFALSVK